MTPETIALLQALIQADPALAEQMKNAETIDNAAQVLAQAASQKDIAIDASAISAHIEASKNVQMSDHELEAVAGGGKFEWVVLSALTFWFGGCR